MKIRYHLIFNERTLQLLLLIPILLFFGKVLMRLDGYGYYSMIYLRFFYSLLLIPILYFHHLNEEIYSNTFVSSRENNRLKHYILTDLIVVSFYSIYVTAIVYIISIFGYPWESWNLLYLFAMSVVSVFLYLGIYYIFRCFFKQEVCFTIIIGLGGLLSFFQNITMFIPTPNALFNIQFIDIIWCRNWLYIFLALLSVCIIGTFIIYKMKGKVVYE
mgnify:CR=1 FL=1